MSMGPRDLPWQQCTDDAPHAGHSHVNGGPRGGCGLPEWCPGVPEPRSTPGPSTGTPEPSQAAIEAHSRVVARLREAIDDAVWDVLSGYHEVMDVEARAGEVADAVLAVLHNRGLTR